MVPVIGAAATAPAAGVAVDPATAGAAAVDGQETQTLVRLGTDSNVNTLGTTYQYIAVSDAASAPGIRG